MTNHAAVLHAPGDLRIEDRPEPVPGPGQVVVEVSAVGICGSDVHYYEQGRIGDYVVTSPMVVGHEAAGSITAVGEGVDPGRIGQLVALEPGVPDFSCEQCRLGRYNLCPHVRFFATPPVDGAIIERVLTAAAFAHAAPAGLRAEHAAMAEPVSVGVWACQKAHVGPTDRVLVTGAGAIGLLAAQVARSFGAHHIAITDTNEFRLAIARQLGFEAYVATDPIQGQFDVLLECSGAQPALTAGLQCLGPAGRAVLIGMGPDELSINVPLLQGRELTLSGVFRYAHSYPTALRLIATGAVEVDPVITHRFGIADTEQAMTLAQRHNHAIKAIVNPQS